MSSNLMLHNAKFASKLTTLDALRNLPEPLPMGARHHPIPHAVLVDSVVSEAVTRGYQVTRQQLALAANGHALFGVFDLAPVQQGLIVAERNLSFGLRNSTNQDMGLSGVAGGHVTVCDNLLLSGSTFAFKTKNYTGLDLGNVIATGYDKFAQHTAQLELQITRLTDETLSDEAAKVIVYNVFAARVVPSRLFDDVNRYYFSPTDEQTDCTPRSKWGLYNAFTRAMRDLTPVRLFGATIGLSRSFGINGESDEPVLDAEFTAVDEAA